MREEMSVLEEDVMANYAKLSPRGEEVICFMVIGYCNIKKSDCLDFYPELISKNMLREYDTVLLNIRSFINIFLSVDRSPGKILLCVELISIDELRFYSVIKRGYIINFDFAKAIKKL